MANRNVKFELTAVDRTKKAFNAVKGGLGGLSKGAVVATKALGGVGLSGAAVAGTLALLAKQSFDYIDTLGKTSAQLGVSVGFLQAFQIAAEEAGGSTEGANKSLLKFSKNIGEAGRGLKTQADLFKDLGVEIKDSNGKIKGTEELLLETADGINALGSSAEKNSALTNLFGRSGQQMFAIINQGGEAIDGLKEKMIELGIGIDGDAVAGVERFNDTANILQRQMNSLKDNVFAAFIPILQTFVNQFTTMFKEFAKNEGGIKKFSESLAVNVVNGVQSALLAVQELVISSSRMVASLQEGMLELTGFFGSNDEKIEGLRQRQLEFENTAVNGFANVSTKLGEYKNLIGTAVEAQNTLTNGIKKTGQEGTKAVTDLLSPMAKYQQSISDAGASLEQVGVNSMKKFEDSIVDGLMSGEMSFKGFADQAIKELLRIAVQQTIMAPLTNMFKGMFSFDGGGFTGSGSRTGGVDGKGGFPAILHPNETVVDHTKGQGSGGATVNFNINAVDAAGFDQLLASRKGTITQIINNAMNNQGKMGVV